MAKKRILVVNTFPIKNALTGGQKREEAIVHTYKKAFDTVQYVGVFFNEHYKEYDPADIPIPPELVETMRQSPHTGDIVCGKAIYDNPTVKRKMTALLKRLKPDIVQIEQVFPYFGMKPLLAELGMNPKIVFSSHNVEAPHKREILESVGMDKKEVDPIVKEIDDVEKDLTRVSELVIACTESDRQYYAKYGAKKSIVARNGMAPIKTTQEALSKWRKYFAEHSINKKAVFIGSAHPPNWVGFEQMVGTGVGFMPFDSRILLVGGISDYFEQNFHEEYNPYHLTFWQRVIPCNRPDNDNLAAIIKLADVIILPMTEGGGSNLKTAEAVLSGRPVVGTSHAFRSFDELKDLPNVYIADTPDAFRDAIVRAMRGPIKPRNASERKLADSVLWENCLAGAVKEVGKL
ncbi:MAG TPA: glycosyltransferase [Candidatus Saccharimonadales bacterium]|nr:glycosyltransferase [Candidatus Saccharimonadales bacterium]